MGAIVLRGGHGRGRPQGRLHQEISHLSASSRGFCLRVALPHCPLLGEVAGSIFALAVDIASGPVVTAAPCGPNFFLRCMMSAPLWPMPSQPRHSLSKEKHR
ncbi:hypothetical protein pqer_cds_203 [Pandoravirus quercus]|uniref:Uncharacterized protein n=1 Tax=Pandoravirus quercus TaxID=2107709 RepID=A0A2U7U8A5_9VIRU|nr:hypothetical protein pqer_cds_203 [Pandoravirus quercus]AVK74625.1 hypothetical protein pqer_cds_203 [Pandoravirus quercus]